MASRKTSLKSLNFDNLFDAIDNEAIVEIMTGSEKGGRGKLVGFNNSTQLAVVEFCEEYPEYNLNDLRLVIVKIVR